jgi:hypothetical protein
LATVYPELKAQLALAQKQAKYNKMLELQSMDFHETNFNYEEKIPSGIKLSEAQRKRIP